MSRRDRRKPPYIKEINGVWHFAPGPAMRRAGIKNKVLGPAGSRDADYAYRAMIDKADRAVARYRDAQEVAPSRCVTVGAILDDWSSDANMKGRKKRSPKTIKLYRSTVNQLRPFFGDVPADRLTVAVVEEWFWPAFEAHPHNTHQMFRSLRAAMNYARKRKIVAGHDIADCDFPTPKSRDRLVERHELKALMDAAYALKLDAVARYCALAITSGQRTSDILGMGCELLSQPGFGVTQGKTGADVSMPFHDFALRHLESMATSGDRYIVARPDTGDRYPLRLFQNHWHRVREKAAETVPTCADIWAYDLRTACVVYMAQGGSTLAQIASVTGHKLNSVTRILQHYLPRNPLLAAQAVANIDPENAPVVDLFKDRA